MAQSESKNKAVGYFHIALGLFLMFVFGHIVPPPYPITEVGMQIVGVFLGVVWLWCFVGFLWPSLLALVAFGLTDHVAGFGQVLTGSFGNNVAVQLLFIMILFGSPQHVGVTKYITRYFLTRRIFNNRPIVFAFVFMLATYVLSLAVNVTPALLLMWSVLYTVLKELKYKKGDKFTTFMIVATFIGAISGQATLPFRGSTLALLGNFEAASGQIMPPIPYMALSLIYSLIMFTAYAFIMKIACKPTDLDRVAGINVDMFNKDPLPPMNGLQKANFYMMMMTCILMLIPSLNIPPGFFLTDMIRRLDATGIAILLTGISVLIRIKGQPILDFTAVAGKMIQWDVYVMVATAMVVSSALTSEGTGVVDWMLQTFEPLLGGHSPIVFFIIMLLFGVTATSFASAMVLGISLMPIIVAFGAQTGANIEAVTTVFILLVHYSIILPSASVFAAMLWGNDNWISGKDVFKQGTVVVILATIVAIAIIMPLSLLLF